MAESGPEKRGNEAARGRSHAGPVKPRGQTQMKGEEVWEEGVGGEEEKEEEEE